MQIDYSLSTNFFEKIIKDNCLYHLNNALVICHFEKKIKKNTLKHFHKKYKFYRKKGAVKK